MNNHPWHKLSGLRKRLQGFLIYQASSFVAIYDPVMADKVMYDVLKEQFEENYIELNVFRKRVERNKVPIQNSNSFGD
jgi:hypothetical protein